MSARPAFVAAACAAAFVAAGCAPTGGEIRECASMPVKGWGELTAKEPFARFANRREIVFEPLSETSQLLLGDSSYSYGVLLTYVFAHPGLSRGNGSAEERCVTAASLMMRIPVEAAGERALATFVALLRDNHVPAALLARIDSARTASSAFAALGAFGEAEVSAGAVEHGGRGRFFRVEVRSPLPAAPSRRGVSSP